ncbi:serine hydrolase [Dokdonia sp.]|uniref:serine hydrolase n=1 Tax=Dokdonia sp. TaxID=2024995 RepID=UPI0032642751
MRISIFAIICLLLISCQPATKTEDAPFDQLTQLIDQYANDALQPDHINSIAVAVYKDGKMYHNYFGELDKNAQNKPNDNTLYEIASITKVFAGSLAAKAVLEHKIALDDDIRNYLESPYPNLEFEGHPITIRHLLTHTLGLKDRRPKEFGNVIKKISEGYYENRVIDYTMTDFLEELKTSEVNKKPGTFYEYNSAGPELVAHILGKVYQKPYKELLMSFLSELDMNDTFLLDNSPEGSKDIANGYDSDRKIVPKDKNPLTGGAFGLISTLPDLMKFMKFQLESDDPLIKESTKILYEDDDDNVMGYLWQDMGIAEEEGFYYSKTGTSEGIQSGLLLCPDSNYGQIVLINNNSDESFDDWIQLFIGKIEPDLIKFPKINLTSLLKSKFLENKEAGVTAFNALKDQEDKYFNTSLSYALNRIGYDLLASEKNRKEAIEMFEFAVKKFPDNANLFDSLGEAYLTDENYKKALENYKISLKLNPNNDHAKDVISNIEQSKSIQ